MNILEMIESYLNDNGYDGLYCDIGGMGENGEQCGCPMGDLLIGDDCPNLDCVAAHKRSDGLYYPGKKK